MFDLWSFVSTAALLCTCFERSLAQPYSFNKHITSQPIQRRAAPLRLHPIHPAILNDAGGQIETLNPTMGDYIMHGLSKTMNLVDEDYGLRDSESFYWGVDGNPIANLTAYADGKAVRVLSLERFDHVLENAECSPSSVKLTFTKHADFDAVQAAWQWVNEAEDNYIVLITDTAQCNIADGDETIRQPWHVTRAIFDSKAGTILLIAQPNTWSKAFKNWRLRVRSRGLLSQHKRTERDSIEKRLTIHIDPTIDLAMNFSGNSMTFSDPSDGASAEMTCTLCETYGSLDFDIDITPVVCNSFIDCIEFWNWHPYLEGHISVVAAGVGATVQIQTTVSGAATFAEATAQIFDWQPSFGRVEIPGVLDIGPELKFLIVGELGKVKSAMELTTGVEVDIPDNAIYYIDVHNSANDQISNWTPTFTPLTPEIKGDVSLSASIGGELHLDFEGEIMGIGTAELGILLAAPTFDIDASVFEQADTDGGDACDVPGAIYGANLDVGVGMSLDAYEQAELGVDGHTAAAIGATQTLWSVSTPLFSTCITLDGTDFAAPPTPTATGVVPSGMPGPYGNGSWHAPYPTAYARRGLSP